MHSTVDCADALIYVGAGFGGAGAEGAGNDGAGTDGAGTDGTGVGVSSEALGGMTLEVIDRCCRNEGTAAKVLDAGDLLQNASAALAFRVGSVGAKAQRKIVDIKSGDFILQVSLIRRPSKLTLVYGVRLCPRVGKCKQHARCLIVGERHRIA